MRLRWGLLLVMERAVQGVKEEPGEAMVESQGELGAEMAATRAEEGLVAREVGWEHQAGGLVALGEGPQGAGEQGAGLTGSC